MEDFESKIPILKKILFENKDKLSHIIDDTMDTEIVFNFWMIEKEEDWVKTVNIVNKLVRKKITDFDLLKMPYSPYFIAIQGIQSE